MNLSLKEITKKIAKKEITPEDLVGQYIKNIEMKEEQICAWSYLDKNGAMEVAKKLTMEVKMDQIRSPLHGIPIGIKDNLDVKGMPTRMGSKLNENSTPVSQDAFIIKRLKELGAIVLGKTHMTEYAWLDPGPTKNPNNLYHTPGGSSSGSAAAVAAQMVPITLGSQTAASICRPASYCGVAAFKPTYERSLDLKPLAPSFDTIGFFGKDIETISLLLKSLDTKFNNPYIHKDKLKVGVVIDPIYEMKSKDFISLQKKIIRKLTEEMNAEISIIAPPIKFYILLDNHKKIVAYEAALNYRHLLKNYKSKTYRKFIQLIKNGLLISSNEYEEAINTVNNIKHEFWKEFSDIDFFMAPPTSSVAPKGLGNTGDPSFTIPWTVLGGPLSIIPEESEDKLPIAIMLASSPYSDQQLLSISSLVERLIGKRKYFAAF